MEEGKDNAINTVKETTESDRLLTHICEVLNSKVWPNKVKVEEIMMKKQLSSVKVIKDQYCQIPIFQDTFFQQIKEGYLQIV